MISQPRVVERIQSLYYLTARKYKLQENQQIQQAKLNASKSFNFTLPIRNTPRKLHKIRPEWVLHRESQHNINSPMQAINFVMEGLHIKPKWYTWWVLHQESTEHQQSDAGHKLCDERLHIRPRWYTEAMYSWGSRNIAAMLRAYSPLMVLYLRTCRPNYEWIGCN
jgi:hypothetical protein